MPLLAHLVHEVGREGHGLRGSVVERAEGVPAALAGRDRRVEADAYHVQDLVLVPHRHAGKTDVRQEAALMRVDLVLDGELLGLAPPDVGLGLVVGDDQLDGAAIDAAGLVDVVHGHLGADERGLSACRGRSGQGLHGADLERLGLAEGVSPPRGHRHRRAEGARGGRGESEEPAPRGLAAVPEIFSSGPLLLFPALCHRFGPPCGH